MEFHPCGICGAHVLETDEAVQCDGACSLWHHRECLAMTLAEYLKLSKGQEDWVCLKCSVKQEIGLKQEAEAKHRRQQRQSRSEMGKTKIECKKLEVLTGDQKCVFCQQSDIDEMKYGPVYMHKNIITHYYCLLLSSNMEQNGRDCDGILGFLPNDVHKEVRRGVRLYCTYCKKGGATLGCAVAKCKVVFHLPCGMKHGTLHQFFGEFKSFCAKHKQVQKISPKILAECSKNAMCGICYEKVVPRPVHETLWAPCCQKSAFFHRDCVQKLALSAGYFFKCPLCNNTSTFQKEMKEFGIYIPEQDASWECVPNAYQDLLVRHDTCDSASCSCPSGRKTNNQGTRWELILCKYCGSQGIHIGCGRLKWKSPEFVCDACSGNSEREDESNTRNYEGNRHRLSGRAAQISTAISAEREAETSDESSDESTKPIVTNRRGRSRVVSPPSRRIIASPPSSPPLLTREVRCGRAGAASPGGDVTVIVDDSDDDVVEISSRGEKILQLLDKRTWQGAKETNSTTRLKRKSTVDLAAPVEKRFCKPRISTNARSSQKNNPVRIENDFLGSIHHPENCLQLQGAHQNKFVATVHNLFKEKDSVSTEGLVDKSTAPIITQLSPEDQHLAILPTEKFKAAQQQELQSNPLLHSVLPQSDFTHNTPTKLPPTQPTPTAINYHVQLQEKENHFKISPKIQPQASVCAHCNPFIFTPPRLYLEELHQPRRCEEHQVLNRLLTYEPPWLQSRIDVQQEPLNLIKNKPQYDLHQETSMIHSRSSQQSPSPIQTKSADRPKDIQPLSDKLLIGNCQQYTFHVELSVVEYDKFSTSPSVLNPVTNIPSIVNSQLNLKSNILDMDTMVTKLVSPCRAIKNYHAMEEQTDNAINKVITPEKNSSTTVPLTSLLSLFDGFGIDGTNGMDFKITGTSSFPPNNTLHHGRRKMLLSHETVSLPSANDIDENAIDRSLSPLCFSSDSVYEPDGSSYSSFEKNENSRGKENSLLNSIQRTTINELFNTNESNVQQSIAEGDELENVPEKESNNFVNIGMKITNKIKNKKQHCIYCHTLVSNFARHLIRCHKKEPEVIDFLSLPKSSKERKDKIKIIQSKGNFIHNKKVLYAGQGTLIVSRRPTNEADLSSYLPCFHCNAFFKKKLLFRHQKNCTANPNRETPIKNTILLAMESGKMCELSVKALSEMNHAENSEEDSPSEKDVNIEHGQLQANVLPSIPYLQESHMDSSQPPVSTGYYSEDFSPEIIGRKPKTYNKQYKSKPRTNYKVWSEEEKTSVLKHLGSLIVLKKVPNKEQCMEVKNKENSLNSRTWVEIKSFIHNQIRKKSNVLPPIPYLQESLMDSSQPPVSTGYYSEDFSPEIIGRKPKTYNKQYKSKPRTNYKVWSEEEKTSVLKHLGSLIVLKKVPNKEQCMEVKNKENSLNSRTWVEIKSFIHNQIRKKSNVLPPIPYLQESLMDSSQPPVSTGYYSEDFSPEIIGRKPKTYNKQYKSKPRTNYKVWSEEEKTSVLKHLGSLIVLKKVPNKEQCMEVKNKENSLNSRTWVEIKSFIHNQIRKKSK